MMDTIASSEADSHHYIGDHSIMTRGNAPNSQLRSNVVKGATRLDPNYMERIRAN